MRSGGKKSIYQFLAIGRKKSLSQFQFSKKIQNDWIRSTTMSRYIFWVCIAILWSFQSFWPLWYMVGQVGGAGVWWMKVTSRCVILVENREFTNFGWEVPNFFYSERNIAHSTRLSEANLMVFSKIYETKYFSSYRHFS